MNLKPKILIPIGNFYPDQSGGPSNTLYWLSAELVSSGYEVTILTTNRNIESLPHDKWLKTGYGIIKYVSDKNPLLPIKLIWQTFRQIRHHDIILLTSIFYPLSLISAIIGLIYNKKVIWSPRGEFYPHALTYNKNIKRIYLALVRVLRSKIIFHATCVEEVTHLHSVLGVDVRSVTIPNLMRLSKPQKHFYTDTPYFLYLGRIHPIKALENLLDALNDSGIFKKSQFLLFIVGKGEEDYSLKIQKMAQSYLGEKVKFFGQVNGEEKEQLIANASFLILPSFTENFGNVVIESLAQGTPVIASKGTPWSVLEQRNAGYWCENTPNELKKVIETCMVLPESEYKIMRSNASKLAIDEFEVSGGIKMWTNFFDQIHSSEEKPSK